MLGRRAARDNVSKNAFSSTKIKLLAIVCYTTCVALAFARIVISDLLFVTELLLYIPGFILPLLAIPFTLFFFKSRQLFGFLLIVWFLVSAITLICEQPRLAIPLPGKKAGDGGYTLTYWNVMSYNKGQDGIVEGFLEDDPDIACLLEGTYKGRPPGFLERAMEPFHWTATKQMAIGTGLPIGFTEELQTDTALRVFKTEVQTSPRIVTLLLVDFPGPPRGDTRELFAELKEVIDSTPKPYIVVGDFNTPRGSRQLSNATKGLQDFYSKGTPAFTWLGSWPSVLPIYQIDHAFASDGVIVGTSSFESRGASDHLRLAINFKLKEVTD